MANDPNKPRKGRKPRIAMVTPLPPEMTGIAEYVAILLPALARHFDIDLYTSADLGDLDSLKARFGVHHFSELEANRDRYDEVIYQFGNSPFHSHMVELLDKVPGIVVLHDFFLSSMLAHMDLHEGHPGLFGQELVRSHGKAAQDEMLLKGHLEVAKHYPASRRIIERATGVLVHSEHAGDLRDAFYPNLQQRNWRTVPMPQPAVGNISPEERQAIRSRLGFSAEDFVVISLGFLADTKLNHLLLEALSEPRLSADPLLHVVFVGQNDGAEYGRMLSRKIADIPDSARISITGFVSGEAYRDYLVAADCAVQLRTRSRGETSKAVHDCMSHGLPMVVNDYGSFHELPAETVLRIAADPTPAELAQALLSLRTDPLKRAVLGMSAKHHMATVHLAQHVAVAYADALRKFACKNEAATSSQHGPGLAEAVIMPAAAPRRLMVDLSEVVRVDHGTGIHRVVRNLTRSLLSDGAGHGWDCVPVAHAPDGRFSDAWDYAVQQLGMAPAQHAEHVGFKSGDHLLLLDSAWEHPERFSGTIESMHLAGAKVGAVLYDLIPLRFPHYCVDFMQAVFEKWLRFVVLHCDYIVCISRAVADDLRAWIGETGAATSPALHIGHVLLGSDIGEGGVAGTVSEPMQQAMQGDSAVLMVGTVEPRKRHDLALAAFEQLWEAGQEARLVMVGKQGWHVEELAARLRLHPRLGRDLFWLEQVSNADLDHAYRRCATLLQASEAEGFGLPIVEAGRYGKPLVLADIAVFREIAGNAADYFNSGSADSLLRCLRRERRSTAGMLATISWEGSALQLLDLLVNGGWDHRLGGGN
ncbi:MAG: glycosyltransferase [Pseudoxanthomonas sp.]